MRRNDRLEDWKIKNNVFHPKNKDDDSLVFVLLERSAYPKLINRVDLGVDNEFGLKLINHKFFESQLTAKSMHVESSLIDIN